MTDDPDTKPGDPGKIDDPDQCKEIHIDREGFEVPVRRMTGRELLELAGKKPTEGYAIYLKVKGGQPQRNELDEKIDLSRPTVERFLTLPLDQTEGLASGFHLRRGRVVWVRPAAAVRPDIG